MKTKTKTLIFILMAAAMILSVIPAAFLGSSNQIELPDTETEDLVLSGSGSFEAEITSMPKFISFVGISESSDGSLVREEINKINYIDCTEDSLECQVKVGLNPQGQGYRYEVVIQLKNESDAPYVGFRLSYRLNYLLRTTEHGLMQYALVPSSINLIGTSVIEGNTVTAKNLTSLAYVSYSNKVNETVKVFCNNVVYSKQGILIQAPACIDETQYLNFGLGMFTIVENRNYHNKTLQLDLDFDNVYFDAEGEITEDITSQLHFAEVIVSSENNSISVISDDISKTSEIQNILSGLTIVSSYKKALVQLPEVIELDKEYEVIGGQLYIEFPTTQASGVQNVELEVSTLFDEIIDLRVA